jgi:hypothetical protein
MSSAVLVDPLLCESGASADDCFSATYSDARARFLAACLGSPATRVRSFRNPARGPSGEALYTDVARIGSADADSVLIIQSGTHGVEGFAGSAVQIALLLRQQWRGAAAGAPAVLLVHAINPFGFSWQRRTNEDNIDLNRHFVDFDAASTFENVLYAEIADAHVPRELSAAALRDGDATIRAFYLRHGEWIARQAERGGQTSHAAGLYYRGTRPCWSRRVIESICREHLAHARRAALIDIHTGLGPYAYGEPLTTAPAGSAAEVRCRAWYGPELRSTVNPAAGYAGAAGTMLTGYANAAPHVDWTSIGLEFGTLPSQDVASAERADAWLHRHGNPMSEEGRQIKARLRAALYPDAADWRDAVLKRGQEIACKAIAGLRS